MLIYQHYCKKKKTTLKLWCLTELIVSLKCALLYQTAKGDWISCMLYSQEYNLVWHDSVLLICYNSHTNSFQVFIRYLFFKPVYFKMYFSYFTINCDGVFIQHYINSKIDLKAAACFLAMYSPLNLLWSALKYVIRQV